MSVTRDKFSSFIDPAECIAFEFICRLCICICIRIESIPSFQSNSNTRILDKLLQ